MPTELPTTIIGLIAFLFVGFGYFIWRMSKSNSDIIQVFMLYIEKKNNNLEKTTVHFTDTLQERDKRFDDMLIKHDERHKEMMDDMAARLEAQLPIPKRK